MWTVRFVKNGGRRPLHRGRLYPFLNLPVFAEKKSPSSRLLFLAPKLPAAVALILVPVVADFRFSSSRFLAVAFVCRDRTGGVVFPLIAFRLQHWVNRKAKKKSVSSVFLV
jgi:hypothetical protein